MSPRLAKEIRPLLAPGFLLALIVMIPAALVYLLVPGNSTEYIFVSWIAWTVGAGFLAALVFGIEYQDRTLTLLLSQPETRAAIWRDKLGALFLAIGGLTFVYLGTHVFISHEPRVIPGTMPGQRFILLGFMFIGIAVTTAPFWTGLARSVVGGFVFLTAALFFVAMLALAFSREAGDLFDPRFMGEPAMVLLFTVYTLVAGFSGWRHFTRLQPTENSAVLESTAPSVRPMGNLHAGWLTARKRGPVANLLRKEMMLQKSNVVMAGVFLLVVCGLGMLEMFGAGRNLPAGTLEGLRALPFLAYPLLMAVLSGGTAISEERQLGTLVSSLTLPGAVSRHFRTKFLISTAAFFILGLLLPALLLTLYTAFVPAAAELISRIEWLVWGVTPLVLTGVFLLSLWISSLLGPITRVAVAVVGVSLVLTIAILAAWEAAKVYPATPLDPDARFLGIHPWNHDNFILWPFALQAAVVAGAVFAVLVLLAFGNRNLRWSQPGRRQIIAQMLVCVLLAGGLSFAVGYLRFARQRSRNFVWDLQRNLVEELQNALMQIPDPVAGRSYTWADLIRTGKITPETIRKYEDADTRFTFMLRRRENTRRFWIAEVTPSIILKEAPFVTVVGRVGWTVH